MKCLVLLAVLAHPAETDACSDWPPGVASRGVIPENGADDVPTNARVAVIYDAHLDEVWPAALELRVQGGATVPVTPTSPRGGGVVRMLAPVAPLAASTTYEVLDTLIMPCEDEVSTCVGAAQVIATFTTGTGPDVSPPSLGGVTVTSSFWCNEGTSCEKSPNEQVYSIHIDARDDDHPASWIRFEYLDEAGVVIAGPTRLLRPGMECSGGAGLPAYNIELEVARTFQIRAVDLAGNVEAAAHTLVGDVCRSCEAPDAGAGAVPDGGATPAEDESVGCGCGAGGGPASLWLALICATVRKRRAR